MVKSKTKYFNLLTTLIHQLYRSHWAIYIFLSFLKVSDNEPYDISLQMNLDGLQQVTSEKVIAAKWVNVNDLVVQICSIIS